MKPQAIKRTTTLAALTASLLSLSVAGQAAAKDKDSKPKHEPTPEQESTPKKKQSSPTGKTNQIDLRNKMAGMHVHDGLNLVHSGDGVKLMAEARNNKIVGWSATDDKGNKLPTTVEMGTTVTVNGVTITIYSRPQTLVFKIGRFQ
jgi:hypothetical protein